MNGISLFDAVAAQTTAGIEKLALVESLRKGGFNIYFRHAATDWSQNDQVSKEGDWTSCDPNNMRQLSETGRKMAGRFGEPGCRDNVVIAVVPFDRNDGTAIDGHADRGRAIQHRVLSRQDELARCARRNSHQSAFTSAAPAPIPLTRTDSTPGVADMASTTCDSSPGRQMTLTCGPASMVKNAATPSAWSSTASTRRGASLSRPGWSSSPASLRATSTRSTPS